MAQTETNRPILGNRYWVIDAGRSKTLESCGDGGEGKNEVCLGFGDGLPRNPDEKPNESVGACS